MYDTYSLVTLSIDLIVSDPYDPFIFNCYIIEGLDLYDFLEVLRDHYSVSAPDYTVVCRRYNDDEFSSMGLYPLSTFLKRYNIGPRKLIPRPRFDANHFSCPFRHFSQFDCDMPCSSSCPLVLHPVCGGSRSLRPARQHKITLDNVVDGSAQTKESQQPP